MRWKKNIRKIPKSIKFKLSSIDSQQIKVVCVKKISRTDIERGILSHLNIRLNDNGLEFPSEIIPKDTQGKHSNWNVNGREIIRNDLPMETFYVDVEAPNWGDSYNGTHTVELPNKRYPREYIAPRNSTIQIECANSSPDLPYYILKFQVSEVLNKNTPEFSDRLFDCLNILQENIGSCDVDRADKSFEDYIQTLNVSWDILPPGTAEETIERLFHGKNPSPQERETANERFAFFNSLNPQNFISGASGLQRYFGALIHDNLVVFENIKYGNAIYIMFDNWEKLSQKSRIELLSGKYGNNFERIIHKNNWRDQVRKIIRENRR